jgi:hypothetical protein
MIIDRAITATIRITRQSSQLSLITAIEQLQTINHNFTRQRSNSMLIAIEIATIDQTAQSRS